MAPTLCWRPVRRIRSRVIPAFTPHPYSGCPEKSVGAGVAPPLCPRTRAVVTPALQPFAGGVPSKAHRQPLFPPTAVRPLTAVGETTGAHEGQQRGNA